MKDKSFKTRVLAASTICALGALIQPTGSRADDAGVQLAASDSYWCRMFPSSCGDDTTPGGVQNTPGTEGPAGDVPMAPSTSRGIEAPDAAPSAPAPVPPPTPPNDKPAQ